MPKKFDISKKVMRKVASFEKRRSYVWIFRFLVVILGVLGVAFIFLLNSGQEIAQERSFDLLTLFGEDSEIIRDYWRDTLSIFWLELPKEKIIIGFLFLIVGILIIFLFKKKVKFVIRKLRMLAKY